MKHEHLPPALVGNAAFPAGTPEGGCWRWIPPFTSLDSAVFRPSSRSFQSLDSSFSMVGITGGRGQGQGGEDNQVSSSQSSAPRLGPSHSSGKTLRGPKGSQKAPWERFPPSFKFLLKSSFSWPLPASSKAERRGSGTSPAGERDSCGTRNVTGHCCHCQGHPQDGRSRSGGVLGAGARSARRIPGIPSREPRCSSWKGWNFLPFIQPARLLGAPFPSAGSGQGEGKPQGQREREAEGMGNSWRAVPR